MKEDKRKLKIFETSISCYGVAGAICSYGDVINFTEKGIILMDTCGHLEESGKEMAAFLRQEIKSGWGIEGDAEEELINLVRKLVTFRGELSRQESDDWYDSNSGIYAQFDDEEIHITGAGRMSEPLVRRMKPSKYERLSINSPQFDEYLKNRTPMHNINLGEDEVLILSSDGLEHNILNSFFDNETICSLFSGYIGKCVEFAIQNVLDGECLQPAREIRDKLIDKLGPYFLPNSREYDDVAFVVVKNL